VPMLLCLLRRSEREKVRPLWGRGSPCSTGGIHRVCRGKERVTGRAPENTRKSEKKRLRPLGLEGGKVHSNRTNSKKKTTNTRRKGNNNTEEEREMVMSFFSWWGSVEGWEE